MHSYNTSFIDINLHGSSVGRLFSSQMLYWYTSPDNGDVSNMRDKTNNHSNKHSKYMYFYSHEDVTIEANVGHLLVAYIVLHDTRVVVLYGTSFEGTPYLVVYKVCRLVR